MAVVNTVRNRSAHGTVQQVIGKLTFSGNYPTGGEVLKISDLAVGTDKRPIRAIITGSSQHFLYVYDDGNQKVMVRTPGTPPVEHAAAAYDAAVVADTVEYLFIFDKF
jgi:hypothetical protein